MIYISLSTILPMLAMILTLKENWIYLPGQTKASTRN